MEEDLQARQIRKVKDMKSSAKSVCKRLYGCLWTIPISCYLFLPLGVQTVSSLENAVKSFAD